MQTTTEVSLVQDDHVVEEFATDGADHTLGECVLPWGAWCGEDLGEAHALHPSPKLLIDASNLPGDKAPLFRRLAGAG